MRFPDPQTNTKRGMLCNSERQGPAGFGSMSTSAAALDAETSGCSPPRLCRRTLGMLHIGWFPEPNVGLHGRAPSDAGERTVSICKWQLICFSYICQVLMSSVAQSSVARMLVRPNSSFSSGEYQQQEGLPCRLLLHSAPAR